MISGNEISPRHREALLQSHMLTAQLSHTFAMLNIAISGAGPVGCTIARLLLKSSVSSQINLTIFEKDKSRTSRTSLGGTLDLHPPTGLAAIDAMCLSDSFKRYARYEGEELRMCDQNGVVYMHMTEAPQIEGHEARPEIDRVKLMDVLLEGVLEIAPEIIKWGRQVKEVVPDDKEGQWNVNFEDGSTEGPFDLIIGADGAWSKTRKALTDVEPSYSGIWGVSGHIDEETAGDKWEAISSMVGKGNNFSFSYGRSMVAQRMGDGSLKTSFHGRRDLAWIEDIKRKYAEDDEALRRILLEEYKDWVPEFQQWIKCSTKLWCASLWELPVGQRFKHKKGLTLIGDSAHLSKSKPLDPLSVTIC